MTDRADEVARETAGALMRFVRRAQGMTHDERAWYIEGVRPIIAAALRAYAEEARRESYILCIRGQADMCPCCRARTRGTR